MAGLAYLILEKSIMALEGANSRLAAAVGKDTKAKLSLALYVVAIPLAFGYQWAADAVYVSVALMWLVPDRRIEMKLNK